MITLTSAAASEARRFISEEDDASELALRIGLRGGGCAGFEYVLGLDKAEDGDIVFEQEGVPVIVDPYSLPLLDGATLDWSGGLNGKGFSFTNPNSLQSCGCGKSFSADPAEASDTTAGGCDGCGV